MADHALALLLSLVRGIVALDRSVAAGLWDYAAAGALQRVSDVRVGVIGFGRIGRAFATRTLALGMEVSAYDPLLTDVVVVAAGVRPLRLDELLASSTALSLHAPLTTETRGLIGAAELAQLPEGAFVINVARAPLLDVRAALEALESRHLGGLALDVLDVEPPTSAAKAPSSSRLVVTPHAGWYSEHAEKIVFERTVESVRDVLAGRTPRGAVNSPVR
jgi:D-3-phosphoglycerate dehydrogenase